MTVISCRDVHSLHTQQKETKAPPPPNSLSHSHLRIVHRGTPSFTGNKAHSSWIANTKWEHVLGLNGLLCAPHHPQKSNLPAHSLRESKVISKKDCRCIRVPFFAVTFWYLCERGVKDYGNVALKWNWAKTTNTSVGGGEIFPVTLMERWLIKLNYWG